MAFLTDYSFRQLVEKSEIKGLDKIDLLFFKNNIYDNEYLFYFFNQFDLKKLFREKSILSGDKDFPVTYKEVPDRLDDLNYVLEIKGKVKYHFSLKCVALKRGFKNFIMPDVICRIQKEDKEKHKVIVDDLRNCFKINNYTPERFEKGEISNRTLTSFFNNLFPAKYGIDPILISQSDREVNQFQWYISKKSDNVEVKDSFDCNLFHDKVADLISQRMHLCNSKTLQSLSKYDFLINKSDDEMIDTILTRIKEGNLKNVDPVFIENYGLNNLKIFWISHREIKNMAYRLLSEYFKWTYNLQQKEFDTIYLEQFNIEKCSLCLNCD